MMAYMVFSFVICVIAWLGLEQDGCDPIYLIGVALLVMSWGIYARLAQICAKGE